MRRKIGLIAALALTFTLAACGGGKTESAPAATATKAPEAAKKDDYQPHEHGGLPGLADALKGDDKKEAAKPAEGAKPADAAKPAEAAKPADVPKAVEPAKK